MLCPASAPRTVRLVGTAIPVRAVCPASSRASKVNNLALRVLMVQNRPLFQTRHQIANANRFVSAAPFIDLPLTRSCVARLSSFIRDLRGSSQAPPLPWEFARNVRRTLTNLRPAQAHARCAQSIRAVLLGPQPFLTACVCLAGSQVAMPARRALLANSRARLEPNRASRALPTRMHWK